MKTLIAAILVFCLWNLGSRVETKQGFMKLNETEPVHPGPGSTQTTTENEVKDLDRIKQTLQRHEKSLNGSTKNQQDSYEEIKQKPDESPTSSVIVTKNERSSHRSGVDAPNMAQFKTSIWSFIFRVLIVQFFLMCMTFIMFIVGWATFIIVDAFLSLLLVFRHFPAHQHQE